MPKQLIITEKPSVARDIVDALGGFTDSDQGYWESDDYLCTFAVGHILEMLDPQEIDVAYKRWELATLPIIPERFDLKPKSGHSDRLRTIKNLILREDVDGLINACDAGREGELIFREVIKFIGTDKPVHRLWLQSMTAQAIRGGISHLEDGHKFDGLGAAAECRSIADWLIGINASRAMTIRLRSKTQRVWSAGRVQTPSLALLVERENEILSHIPISYWRVLADFAAGSQRYEGTWYDPEFQSDEANPERRADRLFDEQRASAIVAAIADKQGRASETRKPSRDSAPPLFDLTSLQRTANSTLRWSAARTLQAAQRCYEGHKVLTYPRTSSRCLPSDYVPEVERVLGKFAAEASYRSSARFLLDNGRQNDGKIFKDAGVSDHFAIIPTGQIKPLTGDDAKLFDMVTKRFLAAFHPVAVWEQVDRRTVVEGNHFQSKARTLKEPGWRAVYGEKAVGDDPTTGLAPLLPGSDRADDVSVQTLEARSEAEETKPPPRIGEARLLSLMENAGKQVDDEDLAAALSGKGLGTPATRADIIENLKSKEYVDRGLRPTAKGMRFIDTLRRMNADRITSAELTAELELHLDEVERGERTPESFRSEVIDYTKEIVESASTFEYDEIYPDDDPLGSCPLCGRSVHERAWFYRCKETPEVRAQWANKKSRGAAASKSAAAAKSEASDTAEEVEDCPFRVWKEKSGRYIDRLSAIRLLTDGRTGELSGFKDRRDRTFKGELLLDNGEVVLKPSATGENDQPGDGEATAAVEFQVNPEPLGTCPIHKDDKDPVVETSTEFICTKRLEQIKAGERKPTGFVLPRIVCKREINRDEAVDYLQKGETPLIEDFISKYGRPFKAKLTIRENGRHQFEFPPREKKVGVKKATKKKPAKKKAAKKKSATASETPKKKAVKRKKA